MALAADTGKAEKEVLAAMDAWKKAATTQDRAAFEKLLHPDLTYGHSNGFIENKAQAIDAIVQGPLVYEVVDYSDTKVTVVGGTAVVTGKADYQQRAKADGTKSSVHLSILTVWIKGRAGWQLIGRQAVRPTR